MHSVFKEKLIITLKHSGAERSILFQVNELLWNRAIFGHKEEGFEITKELSEKLKSMDEKPFLDLFQMTKIAIPREIKIGKRKSIKEYTPTEFHLRATCLSHPDGIIEMIGIG